MKMSSSRSLIPLTNFNTAEDRRELLNEIMRKGTSALGTDVPSEREINRLAARSDEEFWLFEKMDEERRQRENYRSRLMEEHEVPEWVYSVPDITARKGRLHDDTPVTGKRIRKEVIRDDVINESQYTKAVENGNDKSKHSSKRSRDATTINNNSIIIINNNTNNQQLEYCEATTKSNVAEVKKVAVMKSDTVSIGSEGKSEDGFRWGPRRPNTEGESSGKSGLEGADGGLNGLTWSVHKRKRSSLV